MSYETLLYEIDGPVLTVTLNRPDKLNAYTATMGAELEDAFLRADADDDIRAIIVTGAGRGFCAGADISAGAGAFDTAAEGSVAFASGAQPRRSGGGFVAAIFNCRKPSIAAINGAAVGGAPWSSARAATCAKASAHSWRSGRRSSLERSRRTCPAWSPGSKAKALRRENALARRSDPASRMGPKWRATGPS